MTSKSEEYRLYAIEAISWARKAKDDKTSQAYLGLAETWLIAALYYERNNQGAAALALSTSALLSEINERI